MAIPSASALFEEQAAKYKAHRPDYPASLYEQILRYHAEHGSGKLDLCVDIATGNGQAAIPLAASFKRVIGVDGSPSQVAQAPPVANIEFRLGTAEATGVENGSVDLVTVAQAYHWFANPSFWAEMVRIIKPRGTIAIWGYVDATLPDTPDASAALDRLYNVTLGPYWDPRRGILDSMFRGLDPPLPAFVSQERHEGGPGGSAPGLVIEKTVPLAGVAAYAETWSAHATFLRTHGVAARSEADPVTRMHAELLAACGAGASDATPIRVVWPVVLLLAVRGEA